MCAKKSSLQSPLLASTGYTGPVFSGICSRLRPGCKLAFQASVYQCDGSRHSIGTNDTGHGRGACRARDGGCCAGIFKCSSGPPAANLPVPAGVHARYGPGGDAYAGVFSQGAPELGPVSGRVECHDLVDADRDQPGEGPLAEPAVAVLAAYADQLSGSGRSQRMAAERGTLGRAENDGARAGAASLEGRGGTERAAADCFSASVR